MATYKLDSTWKMVDDATKATMQTVSENYTIPFNYSGRKPNRNNVETALTNEGLPLPTTNNQYLMAEADRYWLIAYDATNDVYVAEKLTNLN